MRETIGAPDSAESPSLANGFALPFRCRCSLLSGHASVTRPCIGERSEASMVACVAFSDSPWINSMTRRPKTVVHGILMRVASWIVVLTSVVGCALSATAPEQALASASAATGQSEEPAPLLTRNWLLVRSSTGTTLTDEPLQFGRPFEKGEIRGCPRLSVDGHEVEAQADVKTRYPDGSVQFAIVSVVLQKVPPKPSLALTFADGACVKPTPMSSTEMLAEDLDFDAKIALNDGAAGTASARGLIAAGKYKVWTNGPVVTTIVAADHAGKSADLGTSAEKPIRPIFEIQFWRGIKATRTRVVLEIADTEKLSGERYSVAIRTGARAPVLRYERAEVAHPVMTRWTRSFWQGREEPRLDVDYNLRYLAETRAIPNYDSAIRLDPRSRAGLIDAWKKAGKEPFDSGFWTRYMPTTGGRADIGPYPRWMIAWLYDGSFEMKEIALAHADLAGAWPMHLREGSSGKYVDRERRQPAAGLPVSGYARPTLAMLDLGYQYTRREDRVKPVGPGVKHGWVADNAHQPQPFFLPYLLTGEHFYKEQLQFWAGFSLLDDAWGLYGEECYSKNVDVSHLGIGGQLRGVAWGMRMLAEAAWATPDEEVGYKQYLRDAYEDVVTRFEGTRGIERDGNTKRADWQWAKEKGDCSSGKLQAQNPLHYWSAGNPAYGSTASVSRFGAPWQYSFLMYSLNRGAELGLPADALRDWLSVFFLRQVLDPGADPYRLGGYTIPVIDARTKSFFQSWSTVAAEPHDDKGAAEWPPAAAPNSNSAASLDQGFATVALAALASTYGSKGSEAAWETFASKHYASWNWRGDPKWALLPRPSAESKGSSNSPATTVAMGDSALEARGRRSGTQAYSASLPKWVAAKPLFEWFPVPGTELSASKAWTGYTPTRGVSDQHGILAYSGGAVKASGSELFIAGGGHADYSGNEIFSIALGTKQPEWQRRNNPSAAPRLPPKGEPYYPDGRPSARHTYWNIQFDDQRNVLLFVGAPALWSAGANSANTMDGFDLERNEYLPADSFPSQGGIRTYAGGVAKDGLGNIYVHSVRGPMFVWLHDDNRWLSLGDRGAYEIETPYAIDTKRNRMLRIPRSSVPAALFDLGHAAAVRRIDLRGKEASTTTVPGSLAYDVANDVYWYWKWYDDVPYRIDAGTFEVSVQKVTGHKPPTPPAGDGHHQYFGRFAYLTELRALVLMRDAESPLFFIRVAE